MATVFFPYIVAPVITYYTTYYVLRYGTNLIIDKTLNAAWFIVCYPFTKIEEKEIDTNDYIIIDILSIDPLSVDPPLPLPD